MVALVLVDALMQQVAQCGLFPEDVELVDSPAPAAEGTEVMEETVDVKGPGGRIAPLGKKLSGFGVKRQ